MEYTGGYVNFGSSGLKVSRIAFGCGFRGTPDEKYCEEMMVRAIESGVNFIDCSNIYLAGNHVRSEIPLGRALKGRRDNVVLTTKVGSCIPGDPIDANGRSASRYHIMREVENSLTRLQTDHIDLYLIHIPDKCTPLEETVRALEQLCQDGKVRYTGLCNYQAWQVTEILGIQQRINAQPMIGMQSPFNLLNRSLEDEMFPMIREKGMGLMAYSPLATGLLGGQYMPGEPVPEKAFWYHSEIYRRYYPYIFKDQLVEVVMAVKLMAEKYNVTMSQIATAWVLTHPEVSSVVAGANTVEEFDNLLGTFEIHLEQDDVDYLTDLSNGMRSALTIFDVRDAMARIERLAKK